MIYLDINDEIEKKNIKTIVRELNKKHVITEKNQFDTEETKNTKISNCKIVICDDNQNKVEYYKNLKKKVIIFLKKRKSKKTINELYLQKNIFTYTRKNEFKEIIKKQLRKIKCLNIFKKFASSGTIAIIIICLINVISFDKIKESIADKLKNNKIDVEIKPSKEELRKYENIVFLGDSITEYYDLNKYYETIPVVNSGTSGYTTVHLLEIMKEEVYIYNPTKVVILIGINDMNKYPDDLQLIENIKIMVNNIKEKRPKAKIYIQSIYPVDRERYSVLIDNNVDNERIKKVNMEIEIFCKENNCKYINMFENLYDQENDKLIYEYSRDGLHLNDEGYIVVTEKLKKEIDV